MDKRSPSLPLTADIRRLLRGLRWRIRAYVWTDGLLMALIWLGITFWVGLALDYFPVVMWASELSRNVRAAGLLLIALVLLVILYRRILARTFVRLADRSMAILLERRYPEFRDSLVTTVELSRRSPQQADFDPQLLDETRRMASQHVGHVQLGQVFRWPPIYGKLLLVVALAASIAGLFVWNSAAFGLATRRLYLLSDETWPRQAHIEIVGIDVERVSPRTGELSLSETLPFSDGLIKVARGTNAILRVRAQGNAARVPEYCRIYYRTQDGPRGQVNMRRDGSVREDGFQFYSFSGKPFQAILDNLSFDVVGYDHRVRDYTIQIVETPAIVRTTLECTFPEYLRDLRTGVFLAREFEYRSSGVQLPKGTQVRIKMESNKPLQEVEFFHPDTGEVRQVQVDSSGDRRTIVYEVPKLEGSFALDVSLRDADNVLTDTPHRIVLGAVEDAPPKVELVVRGIGSAVTPDVVLPARGTVHDDYAVAEAWFEYRVNDQDPQRLLIPLATDGSADSSLDFRLLRASEAGTVLKPGDRLLVDLKASDRYNLSDKPNIAAAEQLDLEVVTPDELLIRLDRRELSERRRFEHILDEVTQMRDALARVQGELQGTDEPLDVEEKLADEPGEQSEAPGIDLRALRVQQAQRQSNKSAEEVLGVAAAFRSIRDELVNNRIDSDDRQTRLENQVAAPLQKIGEVRFAELDKLLADLEKSLAGGEQAGPAAQAAVNHTNLLIVELSQVLDAMLDIESYNELIEIVRTLIDEQQRLMDETKDARKRSALELLK